MKRGSPIIYILLSGLVIFAILASGCVNQDNFGDKANRTMVFTNNALNATIIVWDTSGHNSTINKSSMDLTYVYTVGNESISTFRFSTTDGKQHTVNVSNKFNTSSLVVLDIDNVPVPEPVDNGRVIKAIQQSGYLQEHNTSLDNSSLELLSLGPYIDALGYGHEASTYKFTTTDGKPHTCHVYLDTPTYYIVIDVDNESLVF